MVRIVCVVVVSSFVFGWWVVFVSPSEVVCGVGGRLILAAERILVVRVVVVSTSVLVGVANGHLLVGWFGAVRGWTMEA